MSTRRQARQAARDATADQVVEAALRIADEEGLDAVTMRRLASEVEVGTMTLYRVFDGKEELYDAMADKVLGRFLAPEIDPDRPTDFVRALARAFLRTMREHPSVMRLVTTRSTTTQDSMHASLETPLARLREIGLAPDDAVHVYGLVLTYALGFAAYQAPRPWGDPDDTDDAAEARRQQALFYESLPLQRFPRMVQGSATLALLPTPEQFEFGLDVIVDRVEALLAGAR